MDAEANIRLRDNEAFLKDVPASSQLAETIDTLDSLDRFTARESVVAMMTERELLEKTEEHTHSVPHGDRSNVPIEPFLTDQWYVNAKVLAEPAIASVREGRTAIVPKSYEKIYFDWMENIQPWCISRQLWWGHRIPAWYGPDGGLRRGDARRRRRRAAFRHYGVRQKLDARRGRARHLVLVGALAVLDARLAGGDAGAEALLSDQRARHRLRHHLLLGRAHDDDGAPLHEGGAVPHASTSTASCATRRAPRCRSRRGTWSIPST